MYAIITKLRNIAMLMMPIKRYRKFFILLLIDLGVPN